MKYKLILTIAACGASLALCPASRAQDPSPAPSTSGTNAGGPGEHRHFNPDTMLQRLTAQLDLTADQQAKIKPILEDSFAKMKPIHEDTTLTPQDRMAKMKAVRDDMNSQINAVLTPDQQVKFAAMQEKMRHRRGGPGGTESQASPAPSASPEPSTAQ